MDVYTFSLVLGATGLGVMGFVGVARHGAADGAHAHAGGAHAHAGGAHAHAGSGAHAHGALAAGTHGHGHAPAAGMHVHASSTPHADQHALHLPHALAWLVSPRVLFGVLLGLGTAGLVLERSLSGLPLLAAALAGGIAFERLVLNALYNFSLRFASRPALTLEAAVTGEATAVTAFDENGHGIVAIEVDGQIVQVLGTLTPSERVLGHRVRVGETLRVEEVDAERNRCKVSLL